MAQSVGEIALDIVMGKNTVSSVAKQAIADVQKTFNDGSATVTDKTKAMGQAFSSVGASMAPMSIAAQGFALSSSSAAMSFETSMAQVKTIAGDTAVSYNGNMMDMSEAILKLSSDTGIAAEDIALSTYGAISAGVDVSESLEFVATANALAVGGFTEMSTSVDVLTTVMNAYGENAGTAESISDKLITTQNLGKTTVDELASSMGRVIPTASAYNVSIDNLCASYVAMTKGGIATAEATTYTKSMLNELSDSGSTVGKVLQEQTGKSFGQLMAEGYSLADVIDILGKSVDGDKEKFAQLFGSAEAGTGALAILNGGTNEFNATLTEMQNSTGAASTAMNQMNDTSAHKMQVAMNDMKNAAIELGGAFAPVMTGIASVVGTLASAFSNLPQPVQTVIAVMLGVVAVASPVLLAVGGIISVVGSLTSAVGLISGALSTFIGFITGSVVPALSGFFAFIAANPIVLAIGAIVAAGAVLIANWDSVKEAAGIIWDGVTQAWDGLCQATSEAWENVKQWTSEAWQNVKQSASDAWENVKQGTSEAWENVKQKTSEAWENVKSTVSEKVNSVKSTVSEKWNNLKTDTSNSWNNIKTTISNSSGNARTGAVNAFNYMKNSIKNTVGGIKEEIVNGFEKAVSYITGLPEKALKWGKDLVQGIINGIKSMFSDIASAASDLAGKIAEYLHFSCPDVGPLSTYEEWMPDFVGGMANGIEDNKYKLIDSVKDMANEMYMPAMSLVPEVNAPALRNVGANTNNTATETGDSRIYELFNKLVEKVQNVGDITIPVYLGNDLLDEQIIKAEDRRTVRSGGRI